jgi:hypothetical protein
MRVTALHRGSYAVEIAYTQGERDPIRLREGAIKGI